MHCTQQQKQVCVTQHGRSLRQPMLAAFSSQHITKCITEKLQSTDDKTQPKAAASQSVHLTAIFKKNGKNKYCEEKSI